MFLFLHYDERTIYFYIEKTQTFADIFIHLKNKIKMSIPSTSFVFCLELNQIIDTQIKIEDSEIKNEYTIEVIDANARYS